MLHLADMSPEEDTEIESLLFNLLQESGKFSHHKHDVHKIVPMRDKVAPLCLPTFERGEAMFVMEGFNPAFATLPYC